MIYIFNVHVVSTFILSLLIPTSCQSGKTSTLRSLTDQEFLSTASTIGIESHLREVDVGGDGVWREVLTAAGHSELAEVILQNLLRKREQGREI